MEFKFRSISEQSSTYYSSPPQNPSSPSNFSFFTHDKSLIRGGFSREEALHREIEKEKIRAEIIAEEIIRRRVLEDEVRREMMIERELGLRFSALPLPRVVPLLSGFEGRDRFREVPRFRGFETMPFQRDPEVANGNAVSSSVALREINAANEVNKSKFIILAKPNVNSAELKRKVTASPSGANVEVTSIKAKRQKKCTDDLSCALCHVTATSEQALKEHLNGKKHKVQERKLLSQKTGFGVGPSPKKTMTDTSKPIQVHGTSSKIENEKVDVNSSSTKVNEIPIPTPTTRTPTQTQKASGSVDTSSGKQKKVGNGHKLKKFRFWCEMCKVGTQTQKVLNCHFRGKKHQAKLYKVQQRADNSVSKKKSAHVTGKQNQEAEVEIEEIKPETVAEEAENSKRTDVVTQETVAKEEIEEGTDVATEIMKQETGAGDENEVGRVDSDIPTTENKNNLIESVGDVIIGEGNNQVVASNGADC